MIVTAAVCAAAFVSDDLVLRLIAAGVASLLGYLAVPTLWACASALTAPRRQRNEARNQVDIERERYGVNDDNWRKAFDTKSEETEDLRGKLGTAEIVAARVPELEGRVRLLEEALRAQVENSQAKSEPA